MKKKPFVLGLSFALLMTFCVPGTFATEAASQPELTCEKIEHTHTDVCYTVSETPSCGLEESDGAHTHDDSCYEEQSVLTCTITEDETHTHEDACYTVERTLVCGQQESAGHIHDADCYVKELTCALKEHTHSEDCYQTPTEPAPEDPQCNCTPVDGVHDKACPLYKETAEPNCTCGSEDGIHLEGCPLYKAPEEPQCNCTPVDGIHAETCPLYQTSAQPEKKECTCGAVAGEDGTIIHAEDCPLYVAPEKPVHIEGCADGCTVEGCTCPCHELSLFERLMTCETLEEFWGLLEGYTDEKLEALLNEEQLLQLNEKLDSLLPPPAPKVIVEESVDNGSSDPMEDSKVIYPTVNYSNVAPFGEPVIG